MLRFCDSFNHYGTNELLGSGVGSKYTATFPLNANATPGTGTYWVISPGTGRYNNSIRCIARDNASLGYLLKTFDNQATWCIGFAIRFSQVPVNPTQICALYDAGTIQDDLRLNMDSTLSIVRGNSTVLTGGKSNFVLQPNIWYYIEWLCTISASISIHTCKVNVNGANVIDVTTGQSTKATGNTTANQVYLGSPINLGNPGGAIVYDFCDYYICDGTGTTNNTFLGDVRVDCRFPLAISGTNASWTANGASAVGCVADIMPNGDTAFISSATTNQLETFTLPALTSTPGTIFGIQVVHDSRKVDAGTRQIADEIRSGGTNYSGTTVNLSNSYIYYTTVWETDPATAAAWTTSAANAVEVGVKQIT